jgi:opacity protein-like surface antigen
MKRSAKATTAFLVAILLSSAQLHAQGVGFSLGGGVGIPLGTYDDIVKTGWQGTAGLSYDPRGFPIGVQVDGSLAQFSDETPFDVTTQLIYGTANAVLGSTGSTGFRPYFIGGVGLYNYGATGSDAPEGSTTETGINLGAGFNVQAGSVGLFTEARWHNVFLDGDDLTFLPITVGVRFGG